MYTVREFEKSQEEFVKLYEFLTHNFATEHSLGSLSAKNFSPSKVLRWMAMNTEFRTFVAVDDDNKIIGSIGLHESSPWWSESKYIADGWLYVLPEHRSSGVAGALLKAANEFSKSKGLPLLVGVLNSTDIEKKFSMMSKKGFAPVGGFFLSEG